MNTNKLLVFLLFLFFATSGFALTYRSDLNNGSWSEYTNGLVENVSTTSYKDTSTEQINYGRNFESNFSLTSGTCNNYFCSFDGTTLRKSDDFHEGSYSAYLTASTFTALNEFVGDTNVGFWYKGTDINCGYVSTDSNTFISISHFNDANWTYGSCIIPRGNLKWAFKGTGYLDDVKVLRNNTGTFRLNDMSCSSIQSCSNIYFDFPTLNKNHLYWIVDYVPNATCTARINNGISLSMTEFASGLYYVSANTNITNFYEDLNLSATCSKNLFQTKVFTTTNKIQKYGLVNNGSFETHIDSNKTTDGCSGDYCYKIVGYGGCGCNENVRTGSVTDTSLGVFDGLGAGKLLFSLWGYAGINGSGCSGANSIYTLQKFDVGSSVVLAYSNADDVNYGFFSDENVFLQEGIASGSGTINAIVPMGYQHFGFAKSLSINCYGAYDGTTDSKYITIDSFANSNMKFNSNLVFSNNLTNNIGYLGDAVTFSTSYYNDSLIPLSDSNCSIIDSTSHPMTYNPATSKFEYSVGIISIGEYTFSTSCTNELYDTAVGSVTITISSSLYDVLAFTPIQNISTYVLNDSNVTMNRVDDKDLIFKAVRSETGAAKFVWSNPDTSGKQYFVYTSSDGVNWVFSDTLTFGATNSTPVQKIWNGTSYDYSFSTNLSQSVATYFKLVYQNPAKFWGTIKNSNDWINVNNPSTFTDANNKIFDVFNDSNYANVQSYTAVPYQNLTSNTLTLGYELQFTAYANSPGVLRVGYRVNEVNSKSEISVTTTATRFSIPITPGLRDAVLIIDSNNVSNNTFYLTDYALIPRAYFYGQLEIKNRDNTNLPTIFRDGNYFLYIKEGIGFNVLTNFYDINGDLKTLKIDTLLNGGVIKTQQFALISSAGKNQVFNQTMDGVIDLNGIAGALNQLDPLRDVTMVATLINSSGQSVAQQFKTIKLLQFPYFASDLSMYFDTLNKKVGVSPTLTFKFNVQDPATLIGFEFNIYDENHSVSSPNYTKTILLNEFGCLTNFNCTKQLTFDDYKWEAETKYTITIVALLKTENKNYTDMLAISSQVVNVTYSSYPMMRILQAYERRDLQYTNTEPIPLVLQVRDDKGTDLFNTLKPYLKLYSTDVFRTDYTSAWLPKSHAYDPITGINYWFWNNIFTKDDGTLFSDGENIGFQALWVDSSQSHQSTSAHPAQLSRRCSIGGYGGFFDNSQLGYVGTLIGTFLTDDFGCSAGYKAGAIVNDITGTPEVIDINTSYVPKSGVQSAIVCLSGINPDLNSYNSIETGLACLVLYKKSEESIDGFNIKITNKNSDLGQTDSSTKQYIEFYVSQEEVWLNDIEQLRQSLNTNYDTKNVRTWGDFIGGIYKGYFGSNRTMGVFSLQSVDFLSGTGLVKGVGIDYNLDGAFDPTLIDGAFFFGMNPKIINLSDYSLSNPEILDLDPKTFRNYAMTKKINVPINNCSLEVGIPTGDTLFRTNSLPSPLVDYIPYRTIKDGNGALRVISATETFNIISDMFSANETKMVRSTAKVTLEVFPTKPVSNDIFSLLKDNWFWIFMGFIVLILITFIVVPWVIAFKSGR